MQKFDEQPIVFPTKFFSLLMFSYETYNEFEEEYNLVAFCTKYINFLLFLASLFGK